VRGTPSTKLFVPGLWGRAATECDLDVSVVAHNQRVYAFVWWKGEQERVQLRLQEGRCNRSPQASLGQSGSHWSG
jgi:hypothetical protein